MEELSCLEGLTEENGVKVMKNVQKVKITVSELVFVIQMLYAFVSVSGTSCYILINKVSTNL